ncbi:MAG: hypothetical protein ACRDNB_01825, partial [Gaiellaceae bacterium]
MPLSSPLDPAQEDWPDAGGDDAAVDEPVPAGVEVSGPTAAVGTGVRAVVGGAGVSGAGSTEGGTTGVGAGSDGVGGKEGGGGSGAGGGGAGGTGTVGTGGRAGKAGTVI